MRKIALTAAVLLANLPALALASPLDKPFSTTIGPFDKEGTYLVKGVANGDAASSAQCAVAVLTLLRSQRVPAQGEESQWDPSLAWQKAIEDAVKALDQNRVGRVVDAAFTTDANKTVSAAARAGRIIDVSGVATLTATRDYTIDAAGVTDPWWIVANLTTGAQSIVVKHTSGTGVTVANGARKLVYFDGTNFVAVT